MNDELISLIKTNFILSHGNIRLKTKSNNSTTHTCGVRSVGRHDEFSRSIARECDEMDKGTGNPNPDWNWIQKIHYWRWIPWIRIVFQIRINGTVKQKLDCVNPNPDLLKGTHPRNLIDCFGLGVGYLNYLVVPGVGIFEFLLVPVTTNHLLGWGISIIFDLTFLPGGREFNRFLENVKSLPYAQPPSHPVPGPGGGGGA